MKAPYMALLFPCMNCGKPVLLYLGTKAMCGCRYVYGVGNVPVNLSVAVPDDAPKPSGLLVPAKGLVAVPGGSVR